MGGCGPGGAARWGHGEWVGWVLGRGCGWVRGAGSSVLWSRGERGRFVATVSSWRGDVGGGVLRLGRMFVGVAHCWIAEAVGVSFEGCGGLRSHC